MDMKIKWDSKAGWHTSAGERFSYYTYFFGQNAVYNLVSTLLTTYLLFLGVDTQKSGLVILAVKLWDAFNDAIFGVLFDKIEFRSGKKYLPWLKIASIAVPVATVFLFMIPSDASEGMQLAWLAVAYIVWDTAYTLCDVPIFGLVTGITENLDERTSLMSYKSIYGGAGSGFCTLVGSILVSEHVGSDFTVVAIIIAVAAIITMNPVAYKAKERVVSPAGEEFTIRKMLSYLVKNKPLLIYYLGFLFSSGLNVSGALTLFASFYLFRDSLFSVIIMIIGVAPSLICSLFVPALTRRFDKKKIYLVCTFLSVAIGLVMFFAGYSNIWVYTALAVLRAVPTAITGVMMFMFTPDCAEYGKFTSGIEAKGITFAIQTFAAKFTGAISGSLGLMLLGWFDWNSVSVDNFEELQALNVTQSDTAIFGLWFTYTLVPTIGSLIAGVVWIFYGLSDKEVQVMADCNSGKITRETANGLLTGIRSGKRSFGRRA